MLELGIPFGTANNKLKKSIMHDLVSRLKLNICFRCQKPILNVAEFSIDHKIDWRKSSNAKALFFDLENIRFSHLSCNIRAARKPTKITGSNDPRIKHGTQSGYERHSCRCETCSSWKSSKNKKRVRKK